MRLVLELVHCPPQDGWQENKRQRKGEIPLFFPASLVELEHLLLPPPALGRGLYLRLAWFSGPQLPLHYIYASLSLQLTETSYGASLPPLSHEPWPGAYFVNAPLMRNSSDCSLLFVGPELNAILLCSQSGTATESGQCDANIQ